jgi:hypothetical protein
MLIHRTMSVHNKLVQATGTRTWSLARYNPGHQYPEVILTAAAANQTMDNYEKDNYRSFKGDAVRGRVTSGG